ncbi:hypothetical protein ACTMTJ_27240 [Phytohabitans sp. LJ34]|uniref:hypothetical protein n=1 Tax=Phytohabitans sp. LJ34 TaxID=3452217 RepID=UPI003F8C6693
MDNVAVLAVVVCGLLTTGCSDADEPKPPAVPCAHDLGGTPPTDDAYRIVLDAVALPAGTLTPQESGEPGRLFAKQGLVVRANTEVDITIAPEAAAGTRIGWGSPAPEATAVHVPACPSGSGWLAFAGGYTVRAPTCVPLVVEAHGRRERVEVSVGADC